LVRDLTHPGGNVTAVASFGADTAGKRLELAREIGPNTARVPVLSTRGATSLPAIETAAKAIGIQLRVLNASSTDALVSAVSEAADSGSRVLVVLDSPFVYLNRVKLMQLALERRLCVIAGFSELAELGALITYDVDRFDLYRQAATYVDKIMKGAKAGDLPVYRPTKFDLAVNLKTARALGVTIPQSVLLRAAKVIE
jgi:putative tryptophan/tyrosine transport system substrate-binding protein